MEGGEGEGVGACKGGACVLVGEGWVWISKGEVSRDPEEHGAAVCAAGICEPDAKPAAGVRGVGVPGGQEKAPERVRKAGLGEA